MFPILQQEPHGPDRGPLAQDRNYIWGVSAIRYSFIHSSIQQVFLKYLLCEGENDEFGLSLEWPVINSQHTVDT